MLCHSLAVKGRKSWAHDVLDTSATHSSLVHEFTDESGKIKDKNTQGHVFMIFNKQKMKMNAKLLCIYYIYFLFHSFDRTGNASLLQFHLGR